MLKVKFTKFIQSNENKVVIFIKKSTFIIKHIFKKRKFFLLYRKTKYVFSISDNIKPT